MQTNSSHVELVRLFIQPRSFPYVEHADPRQEVSRIDHVTCPVGRGAHPHCALNLTPDLWPRGRGWVGRALPVNG